MTNQVSIPTFNIGQEYTLVATCPAGTRVVGGGAEVSDNNGPEDRGDIVSSLPTADGTGYTATLEANVVGSGFFKVRAVCL